MDSSRLDPRLRVGLLACLVAALAYAAARLGGTLEILPEADWPLWPANVIVVAALLLVPRKTWPIVMGAAFAVFVFYNLQIGVGIRSICWLVVSDAVEILIAALGLNYFFEGVPQLNSPKALAKYSVFAGILAPAAGAIFGALATRGNYLTSWRISFFSEAIAFFTILPAILGWIGRAQRRVRVSRADYVEGIVLVAAIISLGYFAFVSRWASTLPALLYFACAISSVVRATFWLRRGRHFGGDRGFPVRLGRGARARSVHGKGSDRQCAVATAFFAFGDGALHGSGGPCRRATAKRKSTA